MPTRVRRGERESGAARAVPDALADHELEAFYRGVFLPLVRRATWKHRLPPEDARDIVQDAFVLALTRLRGSGNPKAWLIQVVDHLSINYRRKTVRRATLAQRWGYGPDHTGTGREEADDRSE
jgi:DNA-directed RNA polymerase specialized sigma24 family protein